MPCWTLQRSRLLRRSLCMQPLLSETVASYLELNGIIQGVEEVKNFALFAAFLQLMSLIINTFYSHKEVACHAGPLNAAGFCGCPCACSPYSARQVASYVELDGRGCGRTLDEGAARHQRECMRVACHAGPFNAAGLCGCLCARSPCSRQLLTSSWMAAYVAGLWMKVQRAWPAPL